MSQQTERVIDEAFFEEIKARMTGHLPGFYDSRKLVYDVISRSEPVSGSIHVEIGTLCGGGTIFMLEALRAKGALDSEYVACVDPFAGFYEKQDPLVSMDTVRANAELFGFDPSRILFFPTLSQDPETLAKLAGYTVNTVFIDGDHRYEGVKADWNNYAPLVMDGGYVLFDDYVGEENGRPKGPDNPAWRSTSWGQVSRFVDVHVLPALGENGFSFVDKCDNAIAFRKQHVTKVA